MKRTLKCQYCGQEFVAGRNDAKFCKKCKATGIHKGLTTMCPACGGAKHAESARCQSCENKYRAIGRSGENSWNWKGGKTEAHGYVFHRIGAGKDAKYVQQHRLLWEQVHGAIPEGFVIHHLNGIKNDNRLENLACLPVAAHSGPAIHKAYKSRIRQLESQLKSLQVSLQQPLEKRR